MKDIESSSLHSALFKAMNVARATNRWLQEAEPWKMKGADEPRRVAVVRTGLEAVYIFMHFLAPFMPLAAQSIFKKLHTDPISIPNLKSDFYNLKPGAEVTVGSVLFSKIETQAEKESNAEKAARLKLAKEKTKKPWLMKCIKELLSPCLVSY